MNIPKEIADRLHFRREVWDPHNRLVSKIDPILKPCEDCGIICDRRVSMTLTDKPFAHWRKHCHACNKHYNNLTKQWQHLSPSQLNRVMMRDLAKRDK